MASDGGRQTSEAPQVDEDRAVSPVFLILLIAFLALAVAMVWGPDYARGLAFPFVLLGYLIALCLHEFGHAIIAYHCGDRTVRAKGYLTLNLMHYTNAQYSILLPLVIMAIGGVGLPGGAVYINTSLLRRRSYSSLVSAGGPLLTAAVLALLMLVLKGGAQSLAAAPVLQASLAFLAMLQVTALLFNLIPCPGLDGWGIVVPFLPQSARNLGRRLAPVAPLLMLVALFYVPGLNSMLWGAIFRSCEFVGLDPRLAYRGYLLFQFWRGI
jgi:Zn-dependent protease